MSDDVKKGLLGIVVDEKTISLYLSGFDVFFIVLCFLEYPNP